MKRIFLYFFRTVILGILGLFFRVPELKLEGTEKEDDIIAVVDKWFEELEKQHKFNGVVLIKKAGITKLSKGYGYKDHQKKERLSPATPMRIASVSKQFTAAAIIFLKSQQKLNYEDQLTKYFPSFPYPNVTIRHLLNQTSGIPDIYQDLAKAHKDEFKILNNKTAVELLIKAARKSSFEPNEKFQYSNTNYILLARIVELIADTSFEDFMQTHIFTPLKMVNTRVWNLHSKKVPDHRLAEDMEMREKVFIRLEPDYLDGVAGDGAIFTSLNDLEIWDEFWYGNNILPANELEAAFQKNKLNNGEFSQYGFGWMLTEKGMWHNGMWLGARSMFVRNPAKKSCFAIIDNSSNLYFDKILNELEKIPTQA